MFESMSVFLPSLKIKIRESLGGADFKRSSRSEGSLPQHADKVPIFLSELEDCFGPVYRIASEFLSPRLKKGSHILDLGGGEGSFAMHLAQARRDVRVQSLIPNLALLNGNREIAKRRGLGNVQFIKDEAKNLLTTATDRTSVITLVLGQCNFSQEKDLRSCLENAKHAFERYKTQIFIFDFCRLKKQSSLADVISIFSKSPTPALRREVLTHLEGSWNYYETARIVDFTNFQGMGHWPGNRIQLFQAHTNLNKMFWDDHKSGWSPSVFSRKQIDLYERLSHFSPF